MKILILNPNQSNNYNRGHQLFRNEIARQWEVVFYGPGYKSYNPDWSVPEIIKEEGPFDLVMTYGLKYSRPFKGLGEVRIPKVHILVEYQLWREEEQDRFLNESGFNLIFTRDSYMTRALADKGIKSHVLPFSVDTGVYKGNGVKKDLDVSVVMSEPVRKGLYPNRTKVKKLIRNLGMKSFTGNVYLDEYIHIINRSKIMVSSESQYHWLPMRHTEIMACGTFLLTEKLEDLDLLYVEDGKHLMIYEGLEDLKEKIFYYLNHEEERKMIARRGEDLVRNVHSNERRVETFIHIIEKEIFGNGSISGEA